MFSSTCGKNPVIIHLSSTDKMNDTQFVLPNQKEDWCLDRVFPQQQVYMLISLDSIDFFFNCILWFSQETTLCSLWLRS